MTPAAAPARQPYVPDAGACRLTHEHSTCRARNPGPLRSPGALRRVAGLRSPAATITYTSSGFSGLRAALSQDFAKSGEEIVIIAGMPFGTPGGANLLRIAQGS
ncbi:MAG: hypothetical protein HYU77_09140 [Betaproteobacteria bacterium]|nr:hypothetical protein [Betaproteobacteria bacterium]